MKKLNLKYVSELIGTEYKKWNTGDVVKITSPTSTGKNYFLFNVLMNELAENEKMLYICNRRALKDESKLDLYGIQEIDVPMSSTDIDWEEIANTSSIGCVDVESYQSLGQRIHNGLYSEHYGDVSFNQYKYVVFDEFHYILEDSFTGMTDLTYKRIMEVDETIKIFMSATMEDLENSIVKLSEKSGNLFEYDQSPDYSYVNYNVFKKCEDIALTIKNDKTDDKWVVFIYAKKQAKKLIEIIGDEKCTYVSSGDKQIEDIVENKTFETKVLISTCVLDNGINLKDDKIRNIVIFESSKTKFIQMLGRLRFVPKGNYIYSNEVELYVPKLSVGNFSGGLNNLIKDRTIIEKYQEMDDKMSFFNTYDRNSNKLPSSLFYNFKGEASKLNMIGYMALLNKIEFYEYAVDRLNKNKYAMVYMRLGWLGLKLHEFTDIEDVIDHEVTDSLETYLCSLTGKLLDKDMQTELINKIDHKVNRRLVKSYSGLNKGLELINIPYTITPKVVKETVDHKRKNITYWAVVNKLVS